MNDTDTTYEAGYGLKMTSGTWTFDVDTDTIASKTFLSTNYYNIDDVDTKLVDKSDQTWVENELAEKQDKLTASTSITIGTDNKISVKDNYIKTRI
jgi:hypothetical protein